MKNIILSIEGMTCSACSNGLEKYLNKQNGIIEASVNLVMANATIYYDENVLNQEKIEKYVKQAGFKSTGIFKEFKIENKNKTEKIKFIVFTILAIILMYISMGHMINLPTINLLDPHKNPINYTIALLILTIAFLVYGYDILKNAVNELMDVSIDETYENEIKKIAQLTEGVMNLGSLRTRKHGASAYVDLVICVDGKLTVTSGHDIATNLEKKIQNDINIVKGITVHVEPCNSCNEKRCNK